MKSRLHGFAAAVILLFTATTGAFAQDDAVPLGVGTAFRLFLEKAFATVIVGDPVVVDVRTDDDHSVVDRAAQGRARPISFSSMRAAS